MPQNAKACKSADLQNHLKDSKTINKWVTEQVENAKDLGKMIIEQIN